MNLRKVLIVYKQSAYQSSFGEYRQSFFNRLEKSGDSGLKNIKRSHDLHYRTLDTVERVFRKRKIFFERSPRGKAFRGDRYDLVLSLGGDGTFLDAARFVTHTPVLGINSDPEHSVGRLCPARRSNLKDLLDAILCGKFQTKKIHRLRIRLNQQTWKHPVLNDVLICHAVPAAMSRYRITVGQKSESQRSSGIWISTAAGSTGAMKSSGGRVLPVFSKRIQYMPRELFEGHGARYRLRGGLAPDRDPSLTVRSQMREGRVYVDGAHVWLQFNYGDRLQISRSKSPLSSIYPEAA